MDRLIDKVEGGQTDADSLLEEMIRRTGALQVKLNILIEDLLRHGLERYASP